MIFFFVINYYMRIRVINDMVIADINEGPSAMWCFLIGNSVNQIIY